MRSSCGLQHPGRGQEGFGPAQRHSDRGKGNGGRANYEELVPRAKLGNSRSVIIESVLTDGTKLKSAPANSKRRERSS